MLKKKPVEPDLSELDTKHRIIEAASYLFGVKGYDGTSTREIAARAGVNIASLNYYFRSKNNLLIEVMDSVIDSFKNKIKSIAVNDDLRVSDFAIEMFKVISEDGPKCLNQFKLIMDASHFPEDKLDPDPIGFDQLSFYLKKELHDSVPKSERIWANNIIFGYVNHISMISVSDIGKKFLEKHSSGSIESSIKKLVDMIVRDLNHRYP